MTTSHTYEATFRLQRHFGKWVIQGGFYSKVKRRRAVFARRRLVGFLSCWRECIQDRRHHHDNQAKALWHSHRRDIARCYLLWATMLSCEVDMRALLLVAITYDVRGRFQRWVSWQQKVVLHQQIATSCYRQHSLARGIARLKSDLQTARTHMRISDLVVTRRLVPHIFMAWQKYRRWVHRFACLLALRKWSALSTRRTRAHAHGKRHAVMIRLYRLSKGLRSFDKHAKWKKDERLALAALQGAAHRKAAWRFFRYQSLKRVTTLWAKLSVKAKKAKEQREMKRQFVAGKREAARIRAQREIMAEEKVEDQATVEPAVVHSRRPPPKLPVGRESAPSKVFNDTRNQSAAEKHVPESMVANSWRPPPKPPQIFRSVCSSSAIETQPHLIFIDRPHNLRQRQ